MEIGPVVDIRNYEEFYRLFRKDYGKDVKAIEFHILRSDLHDKENFKNALQKIEKFLNEKIFEKISFHCPDQVVCISILNKMSNKSGILEAVSLESSEKARSDLMFFIDSIYELKIKQPMIVFHFGIYLPKDFLEKLDDSQLKELRNAGKDAIKEEYLEISQYTKNRGVIMAIETSPIVNYQETQGHFFDQCFEEIQNRHSLLVVDTAHVSMCAEYFKQPRQDYRWMRYLKDEYKNAKSTASLKDFIEFSKDHITWFHISDATGYNGNDEGKPIKQPNSIVDWKAFAETIKHIEKTKKLYGVIEIANAHDDYSKIQKSLRFLKDSYPEVF